MFHSLHLNANANAKLLVALHLNANATFSNANANAFAFEPNPGTLIPNQKFVALGVTKRACLTTSRLARRIDREN